MSRRTVVEREVIGSILVVRCDDGTEWMKLTRTKAGGFHQRRPNAKLTIPRLRELVCAIDAAPDLRALADLERSIVAEFVGDVAVRGLLAFAEQRARVLRGGTRDGGEGPPPRAA